MIKKIVKENYKFLLALILLMLSFYILKSINNFEVFKGMDEYVKKWIDVKFSNRLYKIFNFTSDFIGIYTLIIIAVCMILKFKNKLYIKLSLVSYTFTLLFSALCKIIIGRERPLFDIIATTDPYSFPSGHTIISFVMYYFIAYILSIKSDRKTSIAYYIIATILVFTVSFSRLYLGVHYFTDVVGAMLFGVVILLMLINIVEKNFKRKLL